MNAHNEQHDSASPVVKQNLTTQPAAAQEAVGWQWRWLDTDNTWSEWTDGGSRKEIEARIARWKADGEDHRMQVRPVFAAPVTAAPADHLHAHLLHMLGAKDHEDAGRIIGELHAAAMRTPAAPGIDLRSQMLRLAEKWERQAAEHGVSQFTGNDHLLFANELRAQIDAGPKGALNEQFGSAEGLGSPKGGSDVIERIAALLYQEATDEPWTVAGVEHEMPDRAYYRELARRVLDAAQAGDAEVQP
ncbi:hypothetical protein [Stenotrophomonas sp. Y-13]|uniref:hypothetical protein n=1 Tax=Stenotrophomonas sp. Y-13 TaxID=3384161 RepID=UPI00391730FE